MHFEILVEELSCEMALHNILPKLVTGEHTYRIISFQGKKDLLKKLPTELRGYKKWINSKFQILILIDRDNQNCFELKKSIEKIVESANLKPKSVLNNIKDHSVIIRIAIEELEAWFFGDHEAIKKAYPKVSNSFQNKSQYRNPDQINGGTWEALERILKAAGYFEYGYRKTEAASSISRYMEPLKNRSKSFQVFWSGISEIIGNCDS